ncbi:two-component system sensor histidine kinase NtrB [Marinobacterium weihaiense]|uniref:PAS domain S-box protein n=1 Tax=Marinobacterium weihaiense TaxID=2851016 RepID=A0ABS6MBA3_9GAMM|nr:PAS domain S-box protein [Marinobacterium weihaiense]MBV0933583.1 PAS domain S-box protein [Marinobacterium weihaiense]
MTRLTLLATLLLSSPLAQASLLSPFRNDDGSTRWQYVANFSSGVLIILLTLAACILFVTWRRARRYNLELEEIRGQLEQRVKDRTAKLEQEVAEHVVTTQRLQASESYIQNILRSMPLVLVGMNHDGTITHWNRKAEQLSGIRADNAIGRNLWSIYPDVTVTPRHIERALETGEAQTLRYSQAGSFHMDITVYPLENYSEPGVVVLVDDVTRRVVTENMLIQHDKLSSMGELATAMANDINTPLQAILFDLRSFQSILDSNRLFPEGSPQSNEAERVQHLLHNAAKNGRQVESVIRNLQQFARGRSGEPEDANVIDILEHSLVQANEALSLPDAIPFSSIQIERHFDPDTPLAPCYVTELQQVFLSLFRHAYQSLADKAAQAPAEFKPTLKLYAGQSYDSLSLRIQHNGIGLTSEEQMYLFEPYLHSGNSDQPAAGADKRLSFAYFVITEQHKGHMAVTSDPAVGTTFHLQLELL